MKRWHIFAAPHLTGESSQLEGLVALHGKEEGEQEQEPLAGKGGAVAALTRHCPLGGEAARLGLPFAGDCVALKAGVGEKAGVLVAGVPVAAFLALLDAVSVLGLGRGAPRHQEPLPLGHS